MIKLNQNQYLELNKKYDEHYKKYDYQSYELAKDVYLFGAASRQAEIDELRKQLDEFKNIRMYLEIAISNARDGADEDFDLFLNYMAKILKGQNNG